MDLRAEIVADILSRISVIRTIVHANCVCKRWRRILSEHYFNLHLSRSPAGIISYEQSYTHERYHTRRDDVFKVAELDTKPDKLDILPVTKFLVGAGFKDSVYLLEGSVNGLICIWHPNVFYVSNPITRENIILPDHEYTRYFSESYVYPFHGFGFVKASNLQYKVVYMFLPS